MINRLNNMARLSIAGAEGQSMVLLEEGDDEPPSSAPEVPALERLEPGPLADVVALDSSAIPIAYTDRKWYLVFSVGLAARSGGRYAAPYVSRLGPYVADVARREGDDQQAAARRLREYVEGLAVSELARGGHEPLLVLVDGSLDGSGCGSLGRGALVLGISKTTKLVPPDPASIPPGRGYFKLYDSPCYSTYIARLDEYGIPLRIDATDLEGVRMLLSSDVMVRGYPDTLRLAHYASLISRSEEVAAKAALAGRGASLARPLDRRGMILGVLKVRG